MTAPGSAAAGPVTAAQLTIVPANQASWADLQAIFGTADYPGMCYCQRFKTQDCHWSSLSDVERRGRLRDQTRCDDPRAAVTTGLVAYLGAEPVAWVAVEPRTAYPRLLRSRTVWSGRQEDRADDGVWAVTCFVTRKGYRKRGITYALAAAAADFARDNGARALEAYPMITTPGKEITWGELHVGSRQVFADAGFTEVTHPSPRRVVMRIGFAQRARAVGEYGNRRGGTGAILNQALHWNGRRWSRVSTPDPGGRANGAANFLAGIRCPSPASCWAVGDTEAFGHQALNLVLHWNGHRWSAG